MSTRHLCAGFVIRNGRIAECAPILAYTLKRDNVWLSLATRIGD